MRTIKIGYTRFAVPTNWTTKQLGEFAAQMAELAQVSDLTDKVGESWTHVPYMVSGEGVTIGREERDVMPTYDAARQHLDALKAAAPAEEEEVETA